MQHVQQQYPRPPLGTIPVVLQPFCAPRGAPGEYDENAFRRVNVPAHPYELKRPTSPAPSSEKVWLVTKGRDVGIFTD